MRPAGSGTGISASELDGLIHLTGASVAFGHHRAIEDVTLTIGPGESVGIIGPNGSGKTTILRLIAGLLQPTEGTMTAPDNMVVGYVSQHANHPQWLPLTVGDVIRMGRYGRLGLLGRLTVADRAVVADAASQLQIDDLIERSYGDLSGGQRQRVRIAQVLAIQPNVLILDEPITGLDIPSQQVILDLIDQQVGQGTTVILTTHHLDEARHCRRVLLMAGRIVADGPPDQVLEPANLRATFGDRLLGDHQDHDHPKDMMVIDDHGHH